MPNPNENRLTRRRPVLFPAVCCYDDGHYKLDCTIRDLSDTGARIAFPRNGALADTVHLINVRDRLVHEARVVWKGESEAGLEFQNTTPLNEIHKPGLAYLKRFWMARAIR